MKPASVCCVALLALAAAPARANLITNGSFETTTLTGKGIFAGHVAGWSGGNSQTFLDFPGTADDGNAFSVYGPFPRTSPDGGNFVAAGLEAAPPSPDAVRNGVTPADDTGDGAITQLVTGLTPGQRYVVGFDQAAGQEVNSSGATTERWLVSFGNSSQLSALYSLPQGGVGPWEAQALTFFATGTSEQLSFLAVGTPGGGNPVSFLDGVTVDAVSSQTPVPEPAALAMLGTSLAGFALARGARRRRR